MRLLTTIIAIVAVIFIGVMAYFWLREGSLEGAGREMDRTLESLDDTTQPLQESLVGVGVGLEETIDRAVEGNERGGDNDGE